MGKAQHQASTGRNYFSVVFRAVRGVFKTLRLALPKLGVGWMFALLTINFNRISIVELSIPAVAITAMLALHYFLSPFQVIMGRFADRHPLFGLRRTPYLILGGAVASLVFLALPTVALEVSAGNSLAYLAGFGLFIVFGVCIAIVGDSHHSLIAEVVEQKHRSSVIAVVWTFTILSTIIAAIVMQVMMEEYTHAAMQSLYNLTPFIVIGSAVLGVVGMERRLTGDALTKAIDKAKQVVPDGNPITSAMTVLKENKQAWGFFTFIFVSILAIFLQDNILEPFGAEVFDMSVAETSSFQQMWGGGVLLGMALIGVGSAIFNLNKRNIALVGCAGTALGMGLLASAALTSQEAWVVPSLMFMGFFTGFFNVGALSMMMDMTVEGATGLYMGLWGVAQAFGNGVAAFGGGALHSGLIGTGFMSTTSAYFVIFSLEAVGMTVAGIILWNLSVERFHDISEAGQRRSSSIRGGDAVLAMEADL